MFVNSSFERHNSGKILCGDGDGDGGDGDGVDAVASAPVKFSRDDLDLLVKVWGLARPPQSSHPAY